MFLNKDEKLETLKDLVGSRAAYTETVKILRLEEEEKDIFLRASLEVNKKEPNQKIIDKAYAVLIAKSYHGTDEITNEEKTDIAKVSKEDIQDNIIIEILKEQIGTSRLFMEFINKYNLSREEKALMSEAIQDLKSKSYNINKVRPAYEIVKKYTNHKNFSPSEQNELKKQSPAKQNKSSHQICQQCGATLEPSAKFCAKCGTEVGETRNKANINIEFSKKRPPVNMVNNVKRVLIPIAFIILFFAAYNSLFSSVKVVSSDKVLKRNGLTYLDNEEVPFTGIVERYYDEEKRQIEKRIYYEDGKGVKIESWYENGQKEGEGSSKDGKLDGHAVTWYRNGLKAAEEDYKDGILNGKQLVWYENGEKKSEAYLNDGKLDGHLIGWHQNGQKKVEGDWEDGKPDGRVVTWYKNGQKAAEEEYKDGKLNGKKLLWYETGEKAEEAYLKDGKLDGHMIAWYKNGQKKVEGDWEDGKPDDHLLVWDKNGQKKAERYWDTDDTDDILLDLYKALEL